MSSAAYGTVRVANSELNIALPDFNIFQNDGFKKAKFEAHNALFWMARGANSFLEPAEGNVHLDLCWHYDDQILSTEIFDGDLQIGLSLPELEMFFLQNGEKVKHSFWFDDRTPAFAEAWYLVELLHRDRDRSKFSVDLPFTCTNMLFGDTEEHEASLVSIELQAMQDMVIFTALVFESVEKSFGLQDSGGHNKLHCSPESFNFQQSFACRGTKGATATLGLSVGDELRPTPFYFVTKPNTVSGGYRHPLDYDPNSILSLEVICRDRMSLTDITENLLKKVIGLGQVYSVS